MQTGRIVLHYRASDGARQTKIFKTLAGARAFAHRMIGPHPEMGSNYAVSDDGIGTVRAIEGATLVDLFPEPERDTTMAQQQADELEALWFGTGPAAQGEYPGDDAPDPDAAYERHLETRYQGMDAEEARAFGRWEDAQ